MDFYKEIEPAPKLENFIKCYWILELEHSVSESEMEQQLPPDGCVEVIFNYKSPYLYKPSDEWSPLPRCYIVGQLKTPLGIKADADIGLMAIRLHPWGVFAMFGVSPKTFRGKIVDLTDIQPGLIQTVLHLLQSCSTIEAVKQLESLFLSSSFLDCNTTVDFAMQAANYIHERQGILSVLEMAQHFHLSERQLLRRFEQEVGMSTKAYARIIRFNLLREKILFNDTPSNAKTAADYEYSDQAHLYKEIKEMTGYSPKKMKERFADTMDRFTNGQLEFLAQPNRKSKL